MKDVTVGSISFNTAVLKSCATLKEAQDRYKQFNKETVKTAWNDAKKVKAEKAEA